MEMVSTITTLISNVVTFAGGLLLLFGAVTLGTNLKDHNGPGISSGAWAMAGGVLIIAVATYFGTLTVGYRRAALFLKIQYAASWRAFLPRSTLWGKIPVCSAA